MLILQNSPALKLSCVLLLTSVLMACATASGVANGPNGKPIYFIEAPSAEMAFNKAGEKCPTGYSIVSNPTLNQFNNYIITVECK